MWLTRQRCTICRGLRPESQLRELLGRPAAGLISKRVQPFLAAVYVSVHVSVRPNTLRRRPWPVFRMLPECQSWPLCCYVIAAAMGTTCSAACFLAPRCLLMTGSVAVGVPFLFLGCIKM
jgi:hypothetical protein